MDWINRKTVANIKKAKLQIINEIDVATSWEGKGLQINKLLYLTKYFIQSKLERKKAILCGMKLTHECNLKCQHCPYWQRPGGNLTYKKIKKLFQFLHKQGIRLLIFEGGEPLLWQDKEYNFNDLVDLAQEYFFCVGVTTNGMLPLDLSTDIIWVSIDGLQQTHNKIRGKSFEQIITNIKQSSHPKIFANITINKLNVNEIDDLVKFLSPLVKGITIQFFYPYSESKNLKVSWPKRIEVLKKLISLKKDGLPVSNSISTLKALQNNDWHCESWMIANVEPNGTYTQGCYLKNRIENKNPCELCGFAAHTEISLAYQLNWEAIMVGKEILNIF